MRPLVRSYGVISTVTRSPAKMRILFIRILPERWASIIWPLSNFTRNVPAGKHSSTTPLTAMKPFLLTEISPVLGAFLGINGVCGLV